MTSASKDGRSVVYTCKDARETSKMFVKPQGQGFHIAEFKAGRKRVRLEWFCCST